jgi:hypothetical protein
MQIRRTISVLPYRPTILRVALLALALAGLSCTVPPPQQDRSSMFSSDGYGAIDRLALISSSESRAITPENPTGEPGQGARATTGTGASASRELGVGWKVSPAIVVKAHSTALLADIAGPGSISHMWMTALGNLRMLTLRGYWDDSAKPAIESPFGYFFAAGVDGPCSISSLAVCVNPKFACNCYWPMPFRKHAKITLENVSGEDITLYYQIDYALTEVSPAAAYFHALYRHADPIGAGGIYTILDNVEGRGQYVGTYLTWEPRSEGWWGEGEVKFYVDSDQQYPTYCGTGLEDYFCGSYDFENPAGDHYQPFCTPYSGLIQVIPSDLIYKTGQRFGMFRWHIPDPISFEHSLEVTIQALAARGFSRHAA